MASINPDQFFARGLWSPTRSYNTSTSAQPFADMVMAVMQLNPRATGVQGYFVAVRSSLNQSPVLVDGQTGANTVNSTYWKLIRLNQ